MIGASLTEGRGGSALPVRFMGGARWVRYCGPRSRVSGSVYRFDPRSRWGARSLVIIRPALLLSATKVAVWGAWQ